jgi:hypothetical protein
MNVRRGDVVLVSYPFASGRVTISRRSMKIESTVSSVIFLIP